MDTRYINPCEFPVIMLLHCIRHDKLWRDLFTPRQLVALTTFSDLVTEARARVERDAIVAGLHDDSTPLRDGGTGATAYAEAVAVYLANRCRKTSDYWINAICHVGSCVTAEF